MKQALDRLGSLDLTALALLKSPELTNFSGRVSDSGEGRWTILAAIDQGTPAEVLTASLYQRFASRGEADFANKLISAMRYEFGGHVEKKAGGSRGGKPADALRRHRRHGHKDDRARCRRQAGHRAAARRHAPPATPRAVLAAVADLAKQQGAFDRVSVGFPGVVRRGVTETAPNLHPSWVGVDLDAALTKALGRNVRACNDADMQGLGVVRGNGVELVITLGTGFGSSLFVNGRLIPNVQLAHHSAWRDRTYEEELGLKALEKAGRKKWNRRLDKAIGIPRRSSSTTTGSTSAAATRRRSAIDLPPRVRAVSNIAGLLGGIALWNGKEHDYGVR